MDRRCKGPNRTITRRTHEPDDRCAQGHLEERGKRGMHRRNFLKNTLAGMGVALTGSSLSVDFYVPFPGPATLYLRAV